MTSRARTTVVAALPAEIAPGLGERAQVEVVLTGPGWTWDAPPDLSGGTGPVIVTGACGSLRSGPALGDVVVPDAVLGEVGRLVPDATLVAEVAARASSLGLRLHRGSLAEVPSVVDVSLHSDEDSSRLGAAFVDNESARVAGAAVRAGRPWAVVRFVTDTPAHPLGWMRDFFGGWPSRQPSPPAVLLRSLLRPWHVPRLVRLARATFVGRRAVGLLLRGAALGADGTPTEGRPVA